MKSRNIKPDVADAMTYQEAILKAAMVLLGAAEGARFAVLELVPEPEDTTDAVENSRSLDTALHFGYDQSDIDPPSYAVIAQVFELAARVTSEKYGAFQEEQRRREAARERAAMLAARETQPVGLSANRQ